ncbi:MAG: iron-sulfur cluster-binding domain-containing protein [Clostridiaceae bacterium]|mgnify:CR=1 FL=1|jgi:ferredoxin-NADP reductase|nr:iron-sulfur cluster-binding domain-containing protein [Clostridiaceae bacterium]
MAKPNLRSLDKMKFTKVIPTRNQKISEAPAKVLPPLSSYKANEIAAALHPSCQYLKVARVIDEMPDVKSFILVPDADSGTQSLAYFSAGNYLSIKLTIGSSVITRPYSISSSPKESLAGEYMITIKRTEGGLASNFILDSWQVGTKVTASAPLGDFTYEPLRDAKQIIGLAGGSGITPFRSLAKAIADGDEDAYLTLLYGSCTKAEAIFQEELEALANSCDRFRLVNVLSEQPADACEQGFITAELIGKYAPKSGEYSIFMCGPQAMYEFVDKEIATLGLRNKFVRRELFGEYRHPEKDKAYPGCKDSSFKLTVRICGEAKVISCSVDDTLLVAMEKNGIAAPARCRSGVCGWCHSQLVSGDVYVPKSVDGRRMADLQFGYIHPCCTFPLSDITIDVPLFQA